MSNIDAFYTYSEKNDKKYSIYQAIQSAERSLATNRRFKGNINLDAVRGRQLNEKITLRELNEIQEQIRRDSLEYPR